MSWFIDSCGPCDAVKAAVLANTTAPEGLKATISALLDQEPSLPADKKDSARVKGQGHQGNSWGGILGLTVELFNVAKLPSPPA